MPEHAADRYRIEIEGCSQELRVLRFAAREAISELSHLEVLLASDGELPFDDIVAKKATFRMLGKDGEDRFIHGIVARLRQGDAGKNLTTYAVTIVPRAWKLQHRSDCRIFQEMTGPLIIEEVLKKAGLESGNDYRTALTGTYAPREYCVQYRESDWAFVCRLMEDDGISYYFEQSEDKHVLVITDANSGYAPIAGEASVRFVPPTGAMKSGEHIDRFHFSGEVRTGKVVVRDYNFKKPALLLESEKAGRVDSDLEVYDHPGDYEAVADGDTLAKLRLEERQVLRKVGEGEGAVIRFAAGSTFTLAEHARDAFNREYLITRVEHRGADPSMMEAGAEDLVRYENRFECIPSDVPFRPPLVTPRPTIKGVQSAIVVGPAGEEIHTDEHGRVKVQFHWDRLGKKDDKSSCWIRVSQLWAGEGWGAMFIPRINQEVLVDFMDGDPDRPVITGRVYHGTNVPPYALPTNKTVSTIKSNSSPGGDGFNELRFQDKKGKEEIYLHGQKDWTIVIEHDKDQLVKHDETRKVGNDRTLETGHDQKETIKNDETFDVKHDRKKTVGNDETESIGHDRSIEVGHDHTESIGNNLTISTAKVKTEDVGEDASETIGKKKSVSVGTDFVTEVTANRSTKVGADDSTEVSLSKTLKVGTTLTITVGSAKISIEQSGAVTVEGVDVTVKSSGDTKVESSGKVDVKASSDVNVEASGKVTVKSSGSAEVNASGAVKVKGANVGIN